MKTFSFNVLEIIRIRAFIKNCSAMEQKNVPAATTNALAKVGDFSVESTDVHRAVVESSSAGMPIIIIILAVLAFLFFTCVLSTGRLNNDSTFRPRFLAFRSFDVLLLSSDVQCHPASLSSHPQGQHDRK